MLLSWSHSRLSLSSGFFLCSVPTPTPPSWPTHCIYTFPILSSLSPIANKVPYTRSVAVARKFLGVEEFTPWHGPARCNPHHLYRS